MQRASLLFAMAALLLARPATCQTSKNPDVACAGCHKEIYDRYEQTPMARGSGPALDGLGSFVPGGFRHAPSSVDYRVFLRDSDVWLTYNRDTQPSLHGELKLVYFIGSNQRGRTFLYQQDHRWFQAPINYYSRKALWDMAPGFGAVTSMPSPLPIDANCLHCHTTGVQTALPQARNRYAGAPFLQSGIGCVSCHGDPAAHLATQGHAPIVNPDKLAASRRDSTCLQCHLEGDAAVFRANTSPADFRPGDDLDRYAVYFVKAATQSGGGRAASQYEALLRSACKAGVSGKPGAGDKLTCTTCHDPHSTPTATERVAFYRAKCLTCHTGTAMATQHHPEQQDCATCHMPTRNTIDVSHNQSTDHNIQRNPATANLRFASLSESTELIPVGNTTVTDRDLGLAYAQLAERGDRASGQKALALLTQAEAAGQTDTPVHVQLGFLNQRSGNAARAREEYEAALKADPYEPTALGNLAVLDAANGRTVEAIQLLERVIDADPIQTAAGLNLALIQCRLGDKQKALATLQTLSRFAPDNPQLHTFLATGSYAGQRCTLQ
ncbi:tetratricopeptide repeat protein [Granulicella arctica]|uniref:Flp pilus assembly protein TadD n=1 Tax=Granulicella arctica TaxID=940613 RepID=A0A7Y9TF32_9BACT|nr:tetratricopeptide repeat protein [Granulicella arctica]NYF78311.1 Flp pilus assembly protein TadD [Granulicella arctica]